MDDCRRTAERLTAFLDAVLTPEARADVQRHLDGCPACREIASLERGGRTLVRERVARLMVAPVPASLRERCQALARAYRQDPQPSGRPSWTWWPALTPWSWKSRLVPVTLTSTLLVFTTVAVLSLATHSSSAFLAAQLTADHMKCFTLFPGWEGMGSDAHTVEQRLSEHHGWQVQVPPSSGGDGVEFVGARRCLYADGLIPHMMYRAGARDISLYVLNGPARARTDVLTLGHRSRIWSRGDKTFVLVAASGPGDLTAAVRYLMREAQ
jgi:anti-sigma factor RsiW